ncbi:IS110 family transposase [Pseudarthrobacter niigatensis]|uniref:Transposase n=1 Tax=Pseudarthrobacter niigatensis TaxID=369935 RepID=A0AAJ1T0S7_9MICC|nr:IS110 family transposase [Pseudarthrobacter niigatensis]MDQ0147302.1 transposase [Pseudarthrobacter niigatensis]MDQ0267119.1 transposase [Pseudarthrobacter niigatensis]
MQRNSPNVYVGIDTHAETHFVAVIDEHGRRLTDQEFPATAGGYRKIIEFIRANGNALSIGVECTGSYGAEITRQLVGAKFEVIEVNQPSRDQRRRRGKTDQLDAYSAAEAVMSGRASSAPKGRNGLVEALRSLRTVRESALRDRTATINQIKAMLISSPENVRSPYRSLTTPRLVAALAATRPQRQPVTSEECTRYALRLLAKRYQELDEQVRDLTAQIDRLLKAHAPGLMNVFGSGPDTGSQLLITAGDNTARLRSEKQFAALTGSCPRPASSGKTERNRLNRGGDRKANSALHHIVLVRMRYDQRTKDYVARRTAEGLGKKEIMRCLKRYIARQVFPVLVQTLRLNEQGMT